MGLCESSKNENIKDKTKSGKDDRILHSFKSLAITAKSVCKILCDQKHLGCGFLIQLFKRNKQFFCLMTTEQVVNKKMIEDKVTIDIKYDVESKNLEIKLNSEERSIKDFIELNMDIVVIEILPSDNIPQEYFLLPLKDYMDNYNKLINKEIMILHYANGEINSSFGKINRLVESKNSGFIHDACADKGASGSPIFLEGNTRVIVINKSENKNKNTEECFGDFIWPIFKFFKKYSEKNTEDKKYK
jgi:hypothetical protein